MHDVPDRSLVVVDPNERPRGADNYGEQDANGVDLSLIRYMLSLSPLDRLRVMERHARDTLILMEYGRRAREAATLGDR